MCFFGMLAIRPAGALKVRPMCATIKWITIHLMADILGCPPPVKESIIRAGHDAGS